MNNKGFIATSLIYSFFLIFITLFLTIIADYLQNKVLLNTIENGIKDNINNTKSIEDFEVGDILYFGTSNNISIDGKIINKETNWIIAGINHATKSMILYSVDPENGIDSCSSDDCVTLEKIESDLNISSDNNFTRKIKILNTFMFRKETEEFNYKLITSSGEKIIKSGCVKEVNDILNYDDCLTSGGNFMNNYRRRLEIIVSNVKFYVEPDVAGGFTVTEVVVS